MTASTQRIRIRPRTTAATVTQLTLVILAMITVVSFLTFDTRDTDLGAALRDMIDNFRTLLTEARLKNLTLGELGYQLAFTAALGLITTVFGAIIGFFLALAAAQNLAPRRVTNVVKGITAFVRAVPTVMWVLFFAVSAGLGSVAAVLGMTFHSAGYLIKAYSESFEEIEPGVLEALRAGGARWWQVIFQAVVPTSASALISWTFVRFEINFSTAIAMGATAGAGGIGYDMFMASGFYLDLRELGAFTYAVLVLALLLEWGATRLKSGLNSKR